MSYPAAPAYRFGGSVSRQLAMLCVCAVFLLKALIPAGFMPDLSHGETFKLVICTATGPQTVLVDKDMNPLADGEASSSHPSPSDATTGGEHLTLCPFAVNTAMDTVSASVVMGTHNAVMAADKAVPSASYQEVSRFFGNASAQSPPVSSYI